MARDPFARIEERINSTVARRLSNAVAVWHGGPEFGVIFERAPHDALGLVAASAVTCRLEVANTPGIGQGSVLQINQVSWVVAEPVQADHSGWATLMLAGA